MKTDNYCITVQFIVFQNANCIHGQSSYYTCYQVAVVTLFWAEKRKLTEKYSPRVCEIKRQTCCLIPSLNQNRLCQHGDVFTQNFILELKFLLTLLLL